MRELKVSVGMWYMGATGDRFVKAGYRPDRTIEERFEAAGKIAGVGGLEMHYPTEINDKNWKALKQRAADMNLKFVMLTRICGSTRSTSSASSAIRTRRCAGGPSISPRRSPTWEASSACSSCATGPHRTATIIPSRRISPAAGTPWRKALPSGPTTIKSSGSSSNTRPTIPGLTSSFPTSGRRSRS